MLSWLLTPNIIKKLFLKILYRTLILFSLRDLYNTSYTFVVRGKLVAFLLRVDQRNQMQMSEEQLRGFRKKLRRQMELEAGKVDKYKSLENKSDNTC